MKYLLALIVLALCAGCIATSAALDKMRADLQDLQTKPYVTAEDYEELEANVDAIEEAVEQDTENFLGSLSNAETGGLAGLLLAIGIGGAQAYRNRNLPGTKRKPTPPTS
jgi:hypothetical protein